MTNEEIIESLNGCIVSEEYENGKPNGNVTCDLTGEILEASIAALQSQAERDNPKSLTNMNVLFGTPEKVADILLPMLPTMEGFCPYCKHWNDGECKVNPKWDCKNALVNWLNLPYVDKPKETQHE